MAKAVKEKFLGNGLSVIEYQSTPPPRFTEATFIKELESSGIGRPSTFAKIIETVLDSSRGYCETVDKCIVPTDLGIKLSHFLDQHFGDIINPGYTKEMEDSLDKIACKKLKQLDFLQTFYDNLEASIKKSDLKSEQTTKIDKACPKCGKALTIRSGKFGQFIGCTGYPKCKYIEQIKK